MESKRGLSLIALILIIIIIVILASIVTVKLLKNNPSDPSIISSLSENRLNLNIAMTNYISKCMAQTDGKFKISEILFDKSLSGENIENIVAIVDENSRLGETDYYKINSELEKVLEVEAKKYSSANWYVDIQTGSFYLIYNSNKLDTPDWMYNEDNKNKADSNLSQFVMYIDNNNVKSISE